MTELRPWEKAWKDKTKTFLHGSIEAQHPSRTRIAELASEYETVLECGCASALNYPHHKELGTEYIGTDITKVLLDYAKEYYPDIDVREMSILDLKEFGYRSVDTSYCRAVLEHLHPLEWALAVKEMWRVADKQMILALYAWRGKKPPKSVLERMRENKPLTADKFSNSLFHRDIVEVIEQTLDNNAWSYEETKPIGRHRRYRLYVVRRI